MELWFIPKQKFILQLEDLKDCFVGLHGVFGKAESNAQQAVRDKYKDSK